ncbi:MAG: OmpA family protein [Spirochaeta sp.]|jgi:flagellar motor protein MotB|nr:OmpA family protein [Spirochaeta sp.]
MYLEAFIRRVAVVVLVLVATPVVVFAGGAGEEEATRLEIPSQPRQYISPENGDGVQDQLKLPFSDVVVPAEDLVIVEYNLSIFDGDGGLVSLTREQEEERRGFFGNLFGGEKPRVEVPESLTWDGRWNVPDEALPSGVSNGDMVEDGEYTYQLTIIDDAGNFSRSAPFAVTVDNTPPEIGEFTEPRYTVFSPNGDDVRDEIGIPLQGSRELRWNVEIRDQEGDTVFTRVYENENVRRRDLDPSPPETFVWDGSTGTAEEPGEIAPEANYTLVLEGTDRAGNSTEAEHPAEIVLSLTAADLTIRPADGNNAFSPNGDGRRDQLALEMESTDADSVREWRLEVYNGQQVVRSEGGAGAPPAQWRFDGRREDGTMLGEGTVQLLVTADMVNGTTVTSEPLDVIIDTTAPQISVSADTAPAETPNGRPLAFGAGDKQRVEASVRYETGIPWEYRISQDGVPVFSGTAEQAAEELGIRPGSPPRNGMAELSLAWNGVALDTGGAARDGLYELVLTGEDRAGNRLESRPYRVLKDGRQPNVRLTLEGEHLSPLSDGPFGSVNFRTEYGAADIIAEFLFEIINEDDRLVRSEYKRQPFDAFEWNGVTNGGTVVADGTYRGRLRVIYQNGHIAESGTVGPVRADRTAPRIRRLTVEPRRFSPDGDGENDMVTISQEVVPGDDWTGEIRTEEGDVVLRRTYRDTVEPIEWDGRGADGELLPDGDYRYVLSATDDAGNATQDDVLMSLSTEPIVLPDPEMRISLRPNPFSPDGDGVDDTITIGLNLESETEILSWDATIVDHTGRTFRTFSGEGNPPRRIRWNGRSDSGELVESAFDYPFEITLRDDQGNVVTEEATIATDILVFQEADGRLRIRISSIHFAGNTADLFASDDEQLNRNLDTLRRLARILNKYPDRDIIVEGHAAHIYLEDPAMRREQESVLIPLSRARAEEVMRALIILGVDRNRMTVEAYGGDRPVVPHSDRENMWKNRRVEFLLHREGR